jgi:hypothetical protein
MGIVIGQIVHQFSPLKVVCQPFGYVQLFTEYHSSLNARASWKKLLENEVPSTASKLCFEGQWIDPEVPDTTSIS